MEKTNNKSRNKIVLAVVITFVLGVSVGFGGLYLYSSLFNEKEESVNKNYESNNDNVAEEENANKKDENVNKNHESNNDNDSDKDNTNENTDNNSVSVGNVEFYSGDKYTLTLITHYNVEKVTAKGKKVSDDYTFILDIDEYYSGSTTTGSYRVEGNIIYLYFEVGCFSSNGTFNCSLPDGATLNNNNNMLQGTISDDGIILGNLKLVKDVQ